MFLEFNNQEKNQQKSKIFPNLDTLELQNGFLKTSSTDTLSEFSFRMIDQRDENGNFFIYKNESNKNLKVKIFQINSLSMEREVLLATTEEDIKKIIQKYGTASLDANAVEWQFSGKNVLSYKGKLTFPEQNIKYLSLGFIFYYDLLNFLVENNIDSSFFEKDLFTSKPKVFKIFDESGRNISTTIADLRTTDKTESVNASIANLNQVIDLAFPTVKRPNQVQKNIKSGNYSSVPYFSKDTLGNIKFIFNLDFKKLISDNCAIKNLIEKSDFSKDILENSKISSFSVVRREYNQAGTQSLNKRKQVKINTTKTIVQSSQKVNSTTLQTTTLEKYKLSELSLFNDIRSFEIVDREASTQLTNYEYGFKITVNDATIFFIKNLRDGLLENQRDLIAYLAETDRVIKSSNRFEDTEQQSYDPIQNSFTDYFIKNTFPEKYQNKIGQAIGEFITGLRIFGIVKQTRPEVELSTGATTPSNAQLQPPFSGYSAFVTNATNIEAQTLASFSFGSITQNEALKASIESIETPIYADANELYSTFNALLSPISANQTSISYFIKVFSNFILQLEKIIKQNKNNVIEYEKWFGIETLVDTSMPSNFGYSYFDASNQDGLLRISNTILEQKVQEQINFFTDGVVPQEYDIVKYAYVSPTSIRTASRQININSLNEYKDSDFVELEADIRRFKSTGVLTATVSEQNKKIVNTSTAQKLTQTLFGSPATSFELNQSPLSAPLIPQNLLQSSINETLENSNGTATNPKIDVDVDPSNLILSILKYSNVKQIPQVVSTTPLGPTELPFQINGLFSNTTKIFDKSLNYTIFNSGYLKNLVQNSKYILWFNTIQKIEFLRYKNNDLISEEWSILDTGAYNNLENNQPIICRLSSYQNFVLKIDNFKAVELPVYDKYFILTKQRQIDVGNTIPFFRANIAANRYANVFSSNLENSKIGENVSLMRTSSNQPDILVDEAKIQSQVFDKQKDIEEKLQGVFSSFRLI